MHKGLSRRNVLKGSGAAVLGLVAAKVQAAPPASAITPELIAAARKEGKVVYYTSIDLPVAERIAKSFEAKFPGITVRVERTGAERVFQRIGQEYASRIYAVDVVNSSDAAHFIVWKRQGWLAPYLTVEMAENVPVEMRDPDGTFTNQRTHLSAIAYNTSLIKPEDAPKGFNDLLDPKYAGKRLFGAGINLTHLYQGKIRYLWYIVRDLGLVNKGGRLLAVWGATVGPNRQIDREGRPLTGNALLGLLAPDTDSDRLKEDYNAATPDTSAQFIPEIQKALGLYDAFDGHCGNQLLADKKTETSMRYRAMATVLADDRIWVNSASGVCTQLFAVELASLTGRKDLRNDCGGRTPNYDAVNVYRSVLVDGTNTSVDDGVHSDEKVHSATEFPFLAAPQQPRASGTDDNTRN